MFEKVNPSHPDKLADRIAGALVDLSYKYTENPRVAVEVLLGHGHCLIINETSAPLAYEGVCDVVYRITGGNEIVDYVERPQDAHLDGNQRGGIRCGDNGIFKGSPITDEQRILADYVGNLYREIPYDGKYIIDGTDLIACQSYADEIPVLEGYDMTLNPLGPWTGGPYVDAGATNRKLGSDMGDGVTGGGLHGKDLSKADVSVNIYCHLMAQATGEPYTARCAIGDETVDGKPYAEIVRLAREYIRTIGGFEKFAEWGLIRPDNGKI